MDPEIDDHVDCSIAPASQTNLPEPVTVLPSMDDSVDADRELKKRHVSYISALFSQDV